MKLTDLLLAAATGPAPKGFPPNLASWIGFDNQWDALDWIEYPDGRFYRADEDTQRTFLLLVREVQQ